MKNTLKEKMKKGPVFGMTIGSGTPAFVEALGMLGYDFVFIDVEHNPRDVTHSDVKEMILSARLVGLSPLVRVTRPDEIEIRKAFELGAEGVIVPHVHNKEEMEICIRGAKFPPFPNGRRGMDIQVRSAGYGLADFGDKDYIDYSNETELVIPMFEDFEFEDNIEEIFSVPGIDAVNFGPADYSMSLNNRTFYDIDQDHVVSALNKLTDYCNPRGIGVMAPSVPVNYEKTKRLIELGCNMIIMSGDFNNFTNMLIQMKKDIVDRAKEEMNL